MHLIQMLFVFTFQSSKELLWQFVYSCRQHKFILEHKFILPRRLAHYEIYDNDNKVNSESYRTFSRP